VILDRKGTKKVSPIIILAFHLEAFSGLLYKEWWVSRGEFSFIDFTKEPDSEYMVCEGLQFI
jgi:hypothetical protein